MRRAVVDADGNVCNIILCKDEDVEALQQSIEMRLIKLEDRELVDVGYSYDGTNFTAPVEIFE